MGVGCGGGGVEGGYRENIGVCRHGCIALSVCDCMSPQAISCLYRSKGPDVSEKYFVFACEW